MREIKERAATSARPISEEMEGKIHRIFSGKDGKDVMAWLKGQTINQILGANATHGELAYQEGMRAVVGLLAGAQQAHQSRLRDEMDSSKKKD